MNMTLIRPRALLALALLTLPLAASQCGSGDTPAPAAPATKRTLELRVTVAGTEAYAYGQKLPTAYVCLSGQDQQGKTYPLYCQEMTNGTALALTEQDIPADDQCELSVKLKSLGGAPLAPQGSSVKAGVYLNGQLQKELVLDASTYQPTQAVCNGSGATKACEAGVSANFIIR